MTLPFIAALPFIGAMLVALLGRAGRNLQACAAGSATLLAGILLAMLAPDILAGNIAQFHAPWVPALGLSASFWIDPLSLLFGGLILGIGLLIIIYARYYLVPEQSLGQFLCYLMLFQGAMLGIVMSGNILLLLIFWELTSLSSFLLIGFKKGDPASRQGARMSLLVTGGGGFALLAGMLLLGRIAGSFELGEILTAGSTVQASPLYPVALVLILLGCFTKSAQFPFHFWLPRAMAAPTPVSAYLHSATMVKAGIFLLARLWPVLAGTPLWFMLVTSAGLVTMLIGAAIALFKDDLKAILAYSTVSHLGLITMLFGFGTKIAALAGVFHILNHAVFKAALFMNAGIVDHQAGTRNVRQLGGLATLMPITATLGIIAAAAMAGIPPLNGFLSKEMMLEEAAHAGHGAIGLLILILALLAAALSVGYSLRYAYAVYLGKKQPPLTPSHQQVRDPALGLWGPSAVLVALAILIGLMPQWLAAPFIGPAGIAITADPDLPFTPQLWHGFTPTLAMGMAAIAGGIIMLARHVPLARLWQNTPMPDAQHLYNNLVNATIKAARLLTDLVHTHSLQRQLGVLFLVATLLGIEGVISGGYAPGGRALTPAPMAAIAVWLLLVGAVCAVIINHQRRYLALIFISVAGLVVGLSFIYLSAPDLALTQISVETVTVLLLLLALYLLPRYKPSLSSAGLRLRDGLIGVAGGSCIGLASWAIMTRDPNNPISAFHWAHSLSGGGGTNVVNVTLVDFRGFDTFGEIIVMGIAAIAIYALLEPALRAPSAGKPASGVPLSAPAQPDDAITSRSPDRHPMPLVITARFMLPFALLTGVYIFLRGHNMPGGGFIAGLVVSIAFLMQYIASGFRWTSRRRNFDRHMLIGSGVLLAALTGLGSLIFGAPLFTSSYGHITLPLIGEVELASAMLFDTGVAMTVIGAVIHALSELSRTTAKATPPTPDAPPPAGEAP